MYCTNAPTVNAITTETSIPEIIAKALSELMYWDNSAKAEPPATLILTTATATAAPSNSKTTETVVEVGIPKALNVSSMITSVIITARKMTIISEKKNISGWKIPFRATSIIPFEKAAPIRIPAPAIKKMSHFGAAFEPTAEFKKLTASLATPTIKPEIASANNTITRIM